MTISGLQIQNILKTYHKSIRWGSKKTQGKENPSGSQDRVEISVEGRKRQVRQRAANQVIERLTQAKKNPAAFSEEGP